VAPVCTGIGGYREVLRESYEREEIWLSWKKKRGDADIAGAIRASARVRMRGGRGTGMSVGRRAGLRKKCPFFL